ncbi:MAG TPA: hypothetical protein VFK97_01225 [Candidatus Saccharimonadales bacterium]|nr:hypothetical protein [Candidatus Saccharimonadales bacterium]
MPFDESTPPADEGQQQPGDTVAPLHEGVPGELPRQITESEGPMAHEAHGYSVATPKPGEITEVLDDTGTKKIPVRIMEDGSYSYTDADGKQLATGHDLSPGAVQKWGFGLESEGKLVEHNASRAYDKAKASTESRQMVATNNNEASELRERDHPLARVHEKIAESAAARVEIEEEEAEIEYNLQHGIPLTEEQYKDREEELLQALEHLPKLIKDTIEELRRLRENQFGRGESTSVPDVELNNAAQERTRDLVDEEGSENRPTYV